MAKIKKETIESLKHNPIYTTDIKKVKAYQDSLNAYNIHKKSDETISDAYKKNMDYNDILKLIENTNKKEKSIDKYYEKTKEGLTKYNPMGWDYFSAIVNKPVQPYIYGSEKVEMNPIQSIKPNEIEIENQELSPVELKNKKVSVKEPEHFLDIAEPDGKGTKRMYFESREELENFQKENPMLKTGSFSRAKIKPEILEILINKK